MDKKLYDKRKKPDCKKEQQRKEIFSTYSELCPQKPQDNRLSGLETGNKKTGKSGRIYDKILVWNIPPRITCPGVSDWCSTHCYNADGNYYAIAKKSIDVINTEGKVPIKEIHPSNQAKIKLCYPNAVSVLIKEIGVNGEEKRIGREKADTEYYENLNEDKFDVVFANDKRLTVEENAKEFGARVYSYIKYRAYFPPICDMDRLNRKGYAMIAEEFTEKKRVTTHNFHTLSADFFQDSINKFVYQGCKVLEVGPGRGWMRKTCSWPIVTYDVLELTEEMARFLDANEKIISSAARTMIASNKYQVEVCSLADPYFHTETLCELHRILAPGGVLAFTLPSVDWSENLRGDEMTTTFISENGDKAVTYSLVFEAEKIVEILQDCGFKEIKVNEITGKK